MSLGGVGCGGAPDPPPIYGAAGESLPGLSAEQLARFEAGRAIFDKQFTAQDGLGPLFNQARCSSCHDLPALGGTGEETVTKATRFEAPSSCSLLEDDGGDNIQQRATAPVFAHGVRNEPIPAAANRISEVTSPSLFGLGLIERIPRDDFAQRADAEDRNGDGISGRVGVTSGGAPGLFGRKADFATILDFVSGAFRAEMGLTTPLDREENVHPGLSFPHDADPVPEPEIVQEELDLVVDFVRFLAPMGPEAPQNVATRDTIRRGEQLFHVTGCIECHVPTMQTGVSADPAFDRKTVALYSDMLLHDLGPDDRGICGVAASDTEHRTARLMGIRHRVGWMHDGRAATLADAISLHGGEATAVRDRFRRLSPADQAHIIRFVASR